MPPRKTTGLKASLAEKARTLLADAENSQDPELKKLRMKAAEQYFALDIKGSGEVSPRLAIAVILPLIAALVGITIYCGMEQPRVVFGCVLTASLLFSLILMVLLFGLCGVLQDSSLVKLILGMFGKVLAKFKASSDTETAGSAPEM